MTEIDQRLETHNLKPYKVIVIGTMCIITREKIAQRYTFYITIEFIKN